MSIFSGSGVGRVALIADEAAELQFFNLDRLIKRAGLQKEQFVYGVAEPGWRADLLQRGIETVVPLGENALRAALSESGIPRWRGRVAWNDAAALWTIPTWKPSRLLPWKQAKKFDINGRPVRDPDIWTTNQSRFSGQFVRDLHLALHVAKYGFKRTPVYYLEDPDPRTFQAWVKEFLAAYERNPSIVDSYDIETPYKLKNKNEDELEEKEAMADTNTAILRISFSWRPNYAVSIPWDLAHYPEIVQLLEHPGPKLGWNSGAFDSQVIGSQGIKINGIPYDGMDIWKAYESDLPRGLEAVSADATDVLPWKHLSDAKPAWYSAADSDVALRNFLYTRQKLQEQGVWDVVMEDFVMLMPDLQEAGKNGVPIDRVKQEQFRKEWTEELAVIEAQIQTVVPEHLKPTQRYKRTPDVEIASWTDGRYVTTDGRVFREVEDIDKVKVCTNCGKQGVTKGDHTAKKTLGKTLKSERHHPKKCALASGTPIPGIGFECNCPKGWPKKEWDVTPNPCHGAEITVQMLPVTQWDEVLPFNAGSSQQLMHYMRAHGHPIGKHKDDPDKESADKKHLEFLVKHYKDNKLYPLALTHHLLSKTISTYLWPPDEQGLIHQEYVNSPSTLRLGGRAHNLMNVGKRDTNPYAMHAREQIIAGDGYKFVQADSSAIEAVILGERIGDLEFIDVASKSIHAWLVSKWLKWEFTPETVKKIKKEQKKLYDQFKIVFYGTSFGMGPYKMWKDYPEDFPTLEDAERVQDAIFKLIPNLEKYQYNARLKAQKQSFIRSPFSYKHYYYDVYSHKKDRWGNPEFTTSGLPKLKLSKDGKRVVAYEPQHSAAIFGRRTLRLIAKSKWRPYMPANLFVHDGYTLRVPEPMVEEAIDFFADILSRPIPELNGLQVGSEIDIGDNWGIYNDKPFADDGTPLRVNLGGLQTVRRVVIKEQNLTWMEKAA